MYQKIAQFSQLANRTAPVKLAAMNSGNAGAVIAAILKPFKCVDQYWSNFMVA